MRKDILLLALLFTMAFAFADIVPSNFAVSPATFKPGVSGTLAFVLTNNGNRTVTGISLYPSGQYLTFNFEKVDVGSLGPGASTTVTLPFKVSANAIPGVYNVQVAAYWVDVDVHGYKTFSYPLTVSSSVTFQVSSISIDVNQIHPGEAFTVDAIIKNTGGAARNARLTSSSTQFTFSGSSQVLLGDLAADQESAVKIPFTASADLPPGIYSIPLTVTYEDELGTTQTASLSISPVTIYKRSIYFSIATHSNVANILPGQKVTVTVHISNVGTEEARFVKVSLTPNSSSFILLNSGEKYIERIPVNGSSDVSFDLGVNSGTQPGFYPLRVAISFADARGVEQSPIIQNTGLEVAGVSDLDVIASASPAPITSGKKYTLSIQVSNVGTFQLKSVRASVSSDFFDVLTAPDAYIGTLSVDDYSTITYPIYVHEGIEPGRHTFIATITYRDSDNVERSITKVAYLDIVSQEVAARATGTTGGLNGWTLAFVALGVAILGYLGYKRFISRKKR